MRWKHLRSRFNIILFKTFFRSDFVFFFANEIKNRITIHTLNSVLSLQVFYIIYFECCFVVVVVLSFNWISLKFYLRYRMNGNGIYIAGCYGYVIIIIIITFACISISMLYTLLWAFHKQLTIVFLRVLREKWPIFGRKWKCSVESVWWEKISVRMIFWFQ